MKLVKMLMIVALVFVMGGVLGVRLAGFGLQADVPPQAAIAQPPAAPTGLVGVLQAIGAQSLSVQTVEGMQLLTVNAAGLGSESAAINQLKAGDKVAVWTQNIQGHHVVTKIVVVPQSPTRIHYVGLIGAANGDQIDVVGQQGETTTFRIDQTLQNLPDANRRSQVGDTVTIVAKPDPLGDGWLAVAIVKQ